jgi:hypothetical protein
MKNIFLILLFALPLVSCEKDDTTTGKFEIDPTAMVFIKPAETLKSANAAHLTPLEIVQKGTTLRFYNDSLSNNDVAAGFAGKDITTNHPAFLRYGTDIINLDGFGRPYVVPDFIYMRDCVIEIFVSNTNHDTIAYIPNSVVKEAEAGIKAALAAKDTAAVYDIFNDAFKFVPITGAEYRELKRQGLN